MEGIHLGLVRKTFVLVLLSTLLYATFLVTGSLAVIADAVYALTDALFVFSLWLSLLLARRGLELSKTAVRMVSLTVLILSLILLLASALVLYSGFVAAFSPEYTVSRPELVVLSEVLFVLVLFYVYVGLREEALREDVWALVNISKDVERNILASFLVILAGLLSIIGLYTFDAITAVLISSYVLYRVLRLSYLSLRSVFGVSDPIVLDAIVFRARSTGVRVNEVSVIGVGPYYVIELVVDASHLPDPWEKVEEVLKRKIEELVPSSARVVIRSPGGGI